MRAAPYESKIPDAGNSKVSVTAITWRAEAFAPCSEIQWAVRQSQARPGAPLAPHTALTRRSAKFLKHCKCSGEKSSPMPHGVHGAPAALPAKTCLSRALQPARQESMGWPIQAVAQLLQWLSFQKLVGKVGATHLVMLPGVRCIFWEQASVKAAAAASRSKVVTISLNTEYSQRTFGPGLPDVGSK